MRTRLSRLAAVAAIMPVGLAVSAVGGSARAMAAPTNPLTVTGTAVCNSGTGHATWTLHWRIDHTIVATAPVQVVSAEETGLVTSDITSDVSPNPIPAGGSATAIEGPVDNAVGDVILTVTAALGGGRAAFIGAVHLDGSCEVAASTSVVPTTAPATSTTAMPAVRSAVVAQPTFTG